jgi:hypothetical protein
MSDAENVVPVELYGPDDGGWYTTRVHDWIGLCPELRDAEVRGYLILRSLVIEKYKNPVRKLALDDLCALIPGPTKGQPSSLTRVRGILAGLSAVGLVTTPEGLPVKTSSRPAAAGRPIRLRINDMPTKGYSGWRNTEDKLSSISREDAEMSAGRISDPDQNEGGAGQGGGRFTDPPGRKSDPGGWISDPEPPPDLPEPEVPLVPTLGMTGGDAPSARSVVDGRRPSDGSSAREGEGGSAASSNDSPSSTQEDGPAPRRAGRKSAAARHTRDQLQQAQRVLPYFPAELGVSLVPALTQAILDALAGDCPGADRTAAQLGVRIERRWGQHGYAAKHYAGTLDSPVGAAIGMVRPLKAGDRYGCANPRCEDGADVDTGEACTVCPERLAARRAARRQAAAVPPPRPPAASTPARAPGGFRECPCGDPLARASTDTLCQRCRARADSPAGQDVLAPF